MATTKTLILQQNLNFDVLMLMELFTTHTSPDKVYIKVGNTSALHVDFNDEEPPYPVLVKTRFKKNARVIGVAEGSPAGDEIPPMVKLFQTQANKFKGVVGKELAKTAKVASAQTEDALAPKAPSTAWPFPRGEEAPASVILTSAPPSPQPAEAPAAVVSKIDRKKEPVKGPIKGSILRKAKKKPAKKAAPKVKVAAKKAK